MIRKVMLYRVGCDADGCTASPQDGTASTRLTKLQVDVAVAIADARYAGWYVDEGKNLHLCPQHRPES